MERTQYKALSYFCDKYCKHLFLVSIRELHIQAYGRLVCAILATIGKRWNWKSETTILALLCFDLICLWVIVNIHDSQWENFFYFWIYLLSDFWKVSLHTHTNIHIHRHILFLKCLWLYFNPIVLTYPTLFPPNIIFIECCFCNIQGSEWYLIATDCILVTNLWSPKHHLQKWLMSNKSGVALNSSRRDPHISPHKMLLNIFYVLLWVLYFG